MEHRGAFRLSYPMEHGVVVDWKAGEIDKVWAHVYSREQLNIPSEEHPVRRKERKKEAAFPW